MLHRLNAYERQDFREWTWIADSQEDVFGNIRTYPIGVPLCAVCDGPVTADNKCHDCQIEFVHEAPDPLPPELRSENKHKWLGDVA